MTNYTFTEYVSMLNEAKDEKDPKNPEHTSIKQFIAALKNAVWNRETVKIGGSIFTRDELKEVLNKIKDIE